MNPINKHKTSQVMSNKYSTHQNISHPSHGIRSKDMGVKSVYPTRYTGSGQMTWDINQNIINRATCLMQPGRQRPTTGGDHKIWRKTPELPRFNVNAYNPGVANEPNRAITTLRSQNQMPRPTIPGRTYRPF